MSKTNFSRNYKVKQSFIDLQKLPTDKNFLGSLAIKCLNFQAQVARLVKILQSRLDACMFKSHGLLS